MRTSRFSSRRLRRCPRPEALESRRLMAVFSVTSVADGGEGTLRQAILDANGASGADRIDFAIDGDGVQTIRPATPLPIVTGPTTIDGSTQPGYSGTPLVEIDGSAITDDAAAGLSLQGGNSLVRALTINRFANTSGVGIEIQGPGGNRVVGCYLGVTADGGAAAGNRYAGIEIFQSASNTIGGTTSAARNVIAGNGVDIVVGGGSEAGNVIQGNYVGLDATGTKYLGVINTGGIIVLNPGTQIGGTLSSEGNAIVGTLTINGGTQSVGPVGTVVQGNTIGTDASGTNVLGFLGPGVNVSQTDHVTIGGDVAGAGNVIAGNGTGGNGTGLAIYDASDIVVQGNFIGTDRSGTLDLGNGGSGIDIGENSDRITIGGGVTEWDGNIIAHNGAGPYYAAGVVDWLGNHVTIVGNQIYANKGLNIEIGNRGHEPNDPLDADTGPNGYLNVPVINIATTDATGSRIFGSYDGLRNARITLHFYAAPTQGPGADNADATTYLGSKTITTDADGHADYLFGVGSTVPVGWFATATATDASGSTSEFALATAVVSADTVEPPSGTVSFTQDAVTVDESAGVARITVVRADGTGIVSVDYTTTDNTAKAGSDYTATSGTLVFGPGQTSKTIVVPIIDDSLYEPDESLSVSISTSTPGAGLGEPSQIGLTIHDNDPPPPAPAGSVAFETDSTQVNETDGSVTLRLFRTSLDSTTAFVVSYHTEGVTAVAGQEYTATSGTLTFRAGETAKEITVPILDNPRGGPNTRFRVRLDGFATPFTTVSIVNNDRPHTASATPDFDGDGRSDAVLFRGVDNDHWLGVLSSNRSLFSTHFGDTHAGDTPAPGDYDGDGVTDLAVFRPSSATWIIALSTGGVKVAQMGDPAAGDTPAPGDYDGDGVTDFAVFRPSSATWIIALSTGGVKVAQMGDPAAGDVPVPGDYDGDGVTDFAVFRPSNAIWIIRLTGTTVEIAQMGDPAAGDIPAPGDYDGDGVTDFAVFRPSTATWIIRQTGGGVWSFTMGETHGLDIPVTTPYAIRPHSTPAHSPAVSAARMSLTSASPTSAPVSSQGYANSIAQAPLARQAPRSRGYGLRKMYTSFSVRGSSES